MSDKTATSLFMFSPLASKYAGFYQGLLHGAVSYQQLGNRLIQLGEQAHAFRQFDKVKEIGQLLVNIPIKDYQAIGCYFLAVAANSMGNGDQDTARKLFELAADNAPHQYKAKAILSLAAISAHSSDFDSELHYLVEGLKASPNIAITISANRGIAIVKAKEGYHRQALKDLEQIQPLIGHASPLVYFDYLNSYAVELGEAGRKQEAKNVSNIVLASPFIHAYPEWRETAQELREPDRSFITVSSIEREAVDIEPIETHPASEAGQPARVVSFPKLKEAPQPQKPERLTPQQHAQLTTGEKRELVLAAIRSGSMNDIDYDKLMAMVGLLKIGPADKVLDLEDDALLDDIAVVWANHVGPERFAAVLSALRDCEDRLRRNDIIDRMIKIAFGQTYLHGVTEEAWRLEVERRLPKK